MYDRSIVFSKDLLDNFYTLSYGKDIAEGIASIIGNEKAVGEIFHIVQNKSYQWRTILEIYLSTLEKVIGKRPKLVLTEKCTNLQLDYARYQVLYGRYFNRFFDNSKISNYIDTENGGNQILDWLSVWKNL